MTRDAEQQRLSIEPRRKDGARVPDFEGATGHLRKAACLAAVSAQRPRVDRQPARQAGNVVRLASAESSLVPIRVPWGSSVVQPFNRRGNPAKSVQKESLRR